MSPSTVCPTPSRSAPRTGAPVNRRRSRLHVARLVDPAPRQVGRHRRHDGRGTQQVGLHSRPDTAMPRARSGASRTASGRAGSPRVTTSPVSVIHDVVRRPAYSISTRNAGTTPLSAAAHDLAPADLERRPATLRSVAGSKIVHRVARARRRGRRWPARATGSATAPAVRPARAVRCASCPPRSPRSSRRCGRPAAWRSPPRPDLDGAGAGIERELERLQREARIDAGARAQDRRRRRRAEQRHLQPPVFLELEAFLGPDRSG